VAFSANRPFLFFLRDDRTGAVLFAGRLTDPAPTG
jgi:serine protease inhibitor